jgi:hypothetical protein
MPYASKIKHNQHCRDYRKRMPLSVRIKLKKSQAIRKKKTFKIYAKNFKEI